MQNTSELQSDSALRPQKKKVDINDPYSPRRLTDEPIKEFYTCFKSRIDETMSKHLTELCRIPGIDTNAIEVAANSFSTEICTRIDKYQTWEALMIKSTIEMRTGLGVPFRPEPKDWTTQLNTFEDDLNRILRRRNRFGLLTMLSERIYDLLIAELQKCTSKHISQLRSLYQHEYQGAWWTCYIMKEYGISKVVRVPLIVQDYSPLATICSLFAFFWKITPKQFEEYFWFRILGCIALSIVAFLALVPLANGRLMFRLWSFHSEVRPLYDCAIQYLPDSDTNWPYPPFGFRITLRFWRTGGFLPQV